MRTQCPLAQTSPAWQCTRPGDLPPPAAPRAQPPLREVIKGLDARELEGPTVFDQLFGTTPEPGR